MRTLTTQEARAFYDRFGTKQDRQTFYEAGALRHLVVNAGLAGAASVLELGCGTGRFAVELLRNDLRPTARYLGIDISATMVDITHERLKAFGARAGVVRASLDATLPVADASVDRVVSTYVLDLLSESSIRRVLSEARRVLRPGGLLCLASITPGHGMRSRAVTWIWQTVFALNPAWVGGCRPLRLSKYLGPDEWRIADRAVLSAWGIASEVLIASPLGAR